jgi:hypothetical protein
MTPWVRPGVDFFTFRSSPVPKFYCIGVTASGEKKPTLVQCYNQGFDGKEYNWKCETQVDESIHLGEITVTCEGYRDATDSEVLIGSCGLEYTLEYSKKPTITLENRKMKSRNDFTMFLLIVVVFFVLLIIVCMFIGCISSHARRKNNVDTFDIPSSFNQPYIQRTSSYSSTDNTYRRNMEFPVRTNDSVNPTMIVRETTPSPVVVVQQSQGSFFDGYMTGTFHERDETPNPSSSERETHKSVSYGKTKRR